ncbi:hypothetical protein B0T10DRAFT_468820, partial [Thelonectria olida]
MRPRRDASEVSHLVCATPFEGHREGPWDSMLCDMDVVPEYGVHSTHGPSTDAHVPEWWMDKEAGEWHSQLLMLENRAMSWLCSPVSRWPLLPHFAARLGLVMLSFPLVPIGWTPKNNSLLLLSCLEYVCICEFGLLFALLQPCTSPYVLDLPRHRTKQIKASLPSHLNTSASLHLNGKEPPTVLHMPAFPLANRYDNKYFSISSEQVRDRAADGPFSFSPFRQRTATASLQRSRITNSYPAPRIALEHSRRGCH